MFVCAYSVNSLVSYKAMALEPATPSSPFANADGEAPRLAIETHDELRADISNRADRGRYAEADATAVGLRVEIKDATDELGGISPGEHHLAARPNAQRAAACEPQSNLPRPRRQTVADCDSAGDGETDSGGIVDRALDTLDTRDNGGRSTGR